MTLSSVIPCCFLRVLAELRVAAAGRALAALANRAAGGSDAEGGEVSGVERMVLLSTLVKVCMCEKRGVHVPRACWLLAQLQSS